MKNNNGKVAIAIVAMFVVALSVVGFTYAYFTAQVQSNSETTSVEIGAGLMQVKYSHGTKLAAKNIVPGWVSDEYHYYDPILSAETDDSGLRKITAEELVVVDGEKKLPEGSGLSAVPKSDDVNAIVAAPVTLKIENTGNQVAKYAINLRVDTLSGFSATDIENNLVVYLVPGEWDGNKINTATLTDAKVIKNLQVGKNVLSAYEDIAVGAAADNFYVVLEYKNVDSKQESMNASFVAEVEIEGLGQDAQAE